jgi:hypothetical protein
MSGVLVVVDGSAVSETWPVRPDVVVPVVFWESGADIVLGLGWSSDVSVPSDCLCAGVVWWSGRLWGLCMRRAVCMVAWVIMSVVPSWTDILLEGGCMSVVCDVR